MFVVLPFREGDVLRNITCQGSARQSLPKHRDFFFGATRPPARQAYDDSLSSCSLVAPAIGDAFERSTPRPSTPTVSVAM